MYYQPCGWYVLCVCCGNICLLRGCAGGGGGRRMVTSNLAFGIGLLANIHMAYFCISPIHKSVGLLAGLSFMIQIDVRSNMLSFERVSLIHNRKIGSGWILCWNIYIYKKFWAGLGFCSNVESIVHQISTMMHILHMSLHFKWNWLFASHSYFDLGIHLNMIIFDCWNKFELWMNLVDPASSHMLVSKIKPCMSQYKFQHGKIVNGSLKQL